MKTVALLLAVSDETAPAAIQATSPVGGLTALERMAVTCKQAGLDAVFLFTHHTHLKKGLSRLGVTFLSPATAESDPFQLLQEGLSALQGKAEQVLILPESRALVTSGTLRRLLEYPAPVAVPVYRTRAGYPIKVADALIPQILSYTGEGGLEGALAHLTTPPVSVSVDDAGVVIRQTDDTSYAEALSQHDLEQLRPEIKVRIGRQKPFFGPGTRQLLLLVEQVGSLRLACDYMGISYSKGRNMIQLIESQLSYPVLDTKQGGEHGGSSSLTPRGKSLLEAYVAYEAEVKKAAEKAFFRYFPSD